VLTLHTRHLKQDDELLSTYVHEQLHWYLSAHEEETHAAESDLMKLYPDVPVGFPKAPRTRVNLLASAGLPPRTKRRRSFAGRGTHQECDELLAGDHYRWVYRTILQDGPKIDETLRSHHLQGPRTNKVTKEFIKP